MKLIIGGAFQNKKEYAKETFHLKTQDMLDGAVCDMEEIAHFPCLYHFHEFIKKQIQRGNCLDHLVEKMYQMNPDLLVISNELGYGVVPVEAFDREYREMTGRVCTQLANRSDEVHRVVCGIGTVIKHV